jgi:tetratricopeptide (TPR) repeat protein
MQDSAEYYFKTGKIYENLRSYRQALSAYERANIVQPSVSVAQSVMSLRSKMY